MYENRLVRFHEEYFLLPVLHALLLSSGGLAFVGYIAALALIAGAVPVLTADIGLLVYVAIPFGLFLIYGMLSVVYKGTVAGLASGNPFSILMVLAPIAALISFLAYQTGLIGSSPEGAFGLGFVLTILFASVSKSLAQSQSWISKLLTFFPKLLLIGFLAIHMVIAILLMLEVRGQIDQGPLLWLMNAGVDINQIF
ncbi:hypothetical protein [Spongorhabdus nitratireducens]